jgi:transcriptional regulator with XRE-family HTH domain
MKLAEFMETYSLILAEVARETGLSMSFLSELRSGRRNASPGACLAIEEYTSNLAGEMVAGRKLTSDDYVTAEELPLQDDLRSLIMKVRAREKAPA